MFQVQEPKESLKRSLILNQQNIGVRADINRVLNLIISLKRVEYCLHKPTESEYSSV